MIEQNLTTSQFEESMERSFLSFLAREIPEVIASGETIPVLIISQCPNEFFLKAREDNSLIEVEFNQISTEAYALGGVIFDDTATEGASSTFHTYSPYEYSIDVRMNTYTGSGMERAKLDGLLRELFDGLRRGYKSCPVFQFSSETESTTAYDTGCRIRLKDEKDMSSIHAQDEDEGDYLSNWAMTLKCLFYKQADADAIVTITQSVTALY
jgi:hypothetical protein